MGHVSPLIWPYGHKWPTHLCYEHCGANKFVSNAKFHQLGAMYQVLLGLKPYRYYFRPWEDQLREQYVTWLKVIIWDYVWQSLGRGIRIVTYWYVLWLRLGGVTRNTRDTIHGIRNTEISPHLLEWEREKISLHHHCFQFCNWNWTEHHFIYILYMKQRRANQNKTDCYRNLKTGLWWDFSTSF